MCMAENNRYCRCYSVSLLVHVPLLLGCNNACFVMRYEVMAENISNVSRLLYNYHSCILEGENATENVNR